MMEVLLQMSDVAIVNVVSHAGVMATDQACWWWLLTMNGVLSADYNAVTWLRDLVT